MTFLPRALRHLACLLPLALVIPVAHAQEQLPAPRAIQSGTETPWIYEGSDVPRDPEWVFGEMDNGLRYAVRRNGVPLGERPDFRAKEGEVATWEFLDEQDRPVRLAPSPRSTRRA